MDRFHKMACQLCGLPEADWDQLSAHYLTMQVEADRIACLAEFDPFSDLSPYKDELAVKFPYICCRKYSDNGYFNASGLEGYAF